MTAADVLCVTLGVIAALSIAFGAACWGLYLGEKGRRRSAESYLVFGAPEAQPAKRIYPHANPEIIEPTQAPKGFDPQSIERGADQILAEAQAAGMSVSRKEAMQMAESLLTAAIAGGDDLAIP